jgi:uncharacterized protein (TIGR03435 family)
MRAKGSVLLAAAFGLTVALPAQEGGAGGTKPVPAYDVAVVRQSDPEARGMDLDTDADSFRARNVTLRRLLSEAYGVRRDLIAGIPRRLEDARFDVTAKVVDPETVQALKDEQRAEMLRGVLTERFHLRAHVVLRTLPVYEMVVQRGGPRFKETPADGSHVPDMEVWRRRIQGFDETMPDLADALSGQLDHDVIDRTGLTARYDFTLRWNPDADDANDGTLPRNQTVALEDELGLKLRPAKGPVKTLVVEEAEMPGDN